MHLCLAQYWPVKSDNLSGYDPKVIFDEAGAFAVTYPAHTRQGILLSMHDMLRRDLVGQEGREKLIAASCSAWSANPSVSLSSFEREYCELTPEQAANLTSPIEWANSDHLETLQKAWKCIAANKNGPASNEVLVRLLQQGPQGSEEQPDLAIRMWLQSQEDTGRELMAEVLAEDVLEDIHRRRLWAYAIERVKELGAPFFLSLLPKISALANADQTIKAVFDDFTIVMSVLNSQDLKAEMAVRLMDVFSVAATNSTKGRIAEASNQLVNQSALKNFKPKSLHKDEFDILSAIFGARHMKKFEKMVDE